MPKVERIGLAVLWSKQRLVLQLRDFRSDIDDPGMWGFFGGHLDPSESPDAGVRRELAEELGWVPLELYPLGSFTVSGMCMVGFSGALEADLADVVLGEGHDVGVFTMEEIQQGMLYSDRCRRRFSLTPITRQALELWYGLCQSRDI